MKQETIAHTPPARRRLPLPGQRIFRSMVATWLCFGLYFLRGRSGIPF